MGTTLYAGAARRAINPELGTGMPGLRLFGAPIQAIESDLTATVLVLGDGDGKVALIGVDLCITSVAEAGRLRGAVADALGTPVSHVLLNLSHVHSSPALPEFMAMTDSAEDVPFRTRYERDLRRWLVEAAIEADGRLRPARIGTGWGESAIGVYRREMRDGRDVLGEVPGRPIDPSVGVLRVDDLDGSPIAVVLRYSAHPVTVGSRSQVASPDYPGPARDVLERNLGGLALFLQGCGGNVNPRVGIGYEVDCRDTKNRVGLELGGEALKVAAGIRTNTRAGERRPLGNVPNILFTPWEHVDGDTCTHLAAAETTVRLEYDELPSLEQAREILAHWQRTREERAAGGALDWEIRAAKKYEHWATRLVAAVEDGHPTHDLHIQAIRVNDVVIAAMDMEVFFETGLEIRDGSPLPDTFVLGYTNGCFGYLPRGEDYPEGGWKIDESYAVPDLIPQAWAMPVILHPDSARRAVEASLELIRSL
jgi:neutral ceramidase